MSELEYMTGRTYEECLNKLTSLYGSNYQIFKKRFVKQGGVLGFFQKEVVQVSYVVNEPIPTRFTPTTVSNRKDTSFEKERDKILGMYGNQTVVTEKSSSNETDPEDENPSYQKILDEVQSLRADFAGIKSTTTQDGEHQSIVRIREILENNEFSPAYVRGIIERIRREFSLDGLENFQAVQNAVVKWIEDTIQIDDPETHEQPKIIILVGSTGVGKTTTVAKLAARYSPSSRNFSNQSKVHIITIDNYRIAGKDQIEKYGEIMGITVDGCSNADEVSAKVNKYAPESDLILIDTIGFSPRDCDNIGRMRATLQIQGFDTVVYLAMMASTKATDMREIMHQYEIFGYDDVIITKLDETGCVGNLISIVSEKGKKFAYYTTGQRVPADIEKASVGKLTDMLRGLEIQKVQQEQVFPAI